MLSCVYIWTCSIWANSRCWTAAIIANYTSLTGTWCILDDVYCNDNKKPVKHCVVIVIYATKPITVLVIIYTRKVLNMILNDSLVFYVHTW